MGKGIYDKEETFAWRHAGHLVRRFPALGIAACWARRRYPSDDDAICRELRGIAAWHAFAMAQHIDENGV